MEVTLVLEVDITERPGMGIDTVRTTVLVADTQEVPIPAGMSVSAPADRFEGLELVHRLERRVCCTTEAPVQMADTPEGWVKVAGRFGDMTSGVEQVQVVDKVLSLKAAHCKFERMVSHTSARHTSMDWVAMESSTNRIQKNLSKHQLRNLVGYRTVRSGRVHILLAATHIPWISHMTLREQNIQMAATLVRLRIDLRRDPKVNIWSTQAASRSQRDCTVPLVGTMRKWV